MNFITTPLTDKEKLKVSTDIQLIKHLAIASAPIHCRLIVSGGYAVDGSLGLITRPHDDLDIQLFCQSSDAVGQVNKIFSKLQEIAPSVKLTDKGRSEYYHEFKIEGGDHKIDLYYIQTLESPFDENKIVIKQDGSESEPQKFVTAIATLQDVIFEIVSPNEELKDKVYKRDERHDPVRSEHDQDIENLKLLLS